MVMRRDLYTSAAAAAAAATALAAEAVEYPKSPSLVICTCSKNYRSGLGYEAFLLVNRTSGLQSVLPMLSLV